MNNYIGKGRNGYNVVKKINGKEKGEGKGGNLKSRLEVLYRKKKKGSKKGKERMIKEEIKAASWG